MPVMVLTRGLPASGKTTIARAWVAEAPATRARLNRDDLRRSLFDGEGVLPAAQERVVSKVQEKAAAVLLDEGISVVVDDLNLRAEYVASWRRIALAHGAELCVLEVDTPVDECVARDRDRGARGGRLVGEHVIRSLARRFY